MSPKHTAAISRPRATLSVTKRVTDVLIGLVLVLLATPVILLLAVCVALTLRTTPFFRHQRPGLDGRPFTIIKLRTLPTSIPRYADKHVIDIEHMKLPLLCRLLRRTHIDELPQLLLVVTGRMSLVGPRPAQNADVDPLNESFSELRTSVRPGCTGLWQVSAASSGSLGSSPEYDLFYLRHASVRLDLWLMARTVLWMTRIVKPLELREIPQWLLGQGVLPDPAPYPTRARSRRDGGRLVGANIPAQMSEEAALAD